MKITRDTPYTRPAITLTSFTGGSGSTPPGQVLTSTGSNGGTAWGSNVAMVTSNGSNLISGPFVNFNAGSGIALAASSNTITISALSSGAAGDFVTTTEGGGEVVSTVASSGATETIDLTDGNVHDVTLTANCTFTFNSVATGRARSFTLILRQDGTGSRLATWPGSVVWAGGVAPTLSTAASSVDVLTFFTLDGGTVWYGFSTGGGSTIDYAEAGDLAAVGTTASAGVSTEVPRADHVHTISTAAVSGAGAVGAILISDTPSTPLVFADLLQNEAQDDLLYGDL